MKNGMMVGGTLLLLAARSALADETVSYDQAQRPAPREYYRAGELSLDAFGAVSVGHYTLNHWSGERVSEHAQWGGGLGANYFFIRNLGIGADMYSVNTTGAAIDSASANIILRLPLGNSGFAPYGYAGGGYHFDTIKAWFCQLGAGLEFRFTPCIGAFVDARWVLPDEAKYYGVGRFGLRFAF